VRGGLREQGVHYCFENTICVAEDIVVPEAKNAIASLSKPPVPNDVSRLVCMLPTVDLDDQFSFSTAEIGDARSNRVLADEFESIELSRSQSIPQS